MVEKRGRPKKNKETVKKKEKGSKGRPAGVTNKPNFFKDNTTYVHQNIYVINVFKKLLKEDIKYSKEELLNLLREYKENNTFFYQEKYNERNVYEELIEYLHNIKLLFYDKKEKKYELNPRFTINQ